MATPEDGAAFRAVLDRATIEASTGLEQLQAIADGRLPPPPMAVTLDYRLVAVEHGRAVFAGTPGPATLNPMGTVHGGWAATVLDSALACAVHATLAPGETYTTVEMKVNFTRAVRPGVRLVCEGRVVHRGSRLATAEATLKDEAGRLYAHGTETCMIFAAVEEHPSKR
jgi:uncharacterized protein (TIGR00369 family)